MKRCASCGRAAYDSIGIEEQVVCPWCGGMLKNDIAGPRTIADVVQVLWSVDPEAPFDGGRAEKDLADLCPWMKKAAVDVRIAGEVGALELLRVGRAEEAHGVLSEDAQWDETAAEEFVSAYFSLNPWATRSDSDNQKHEVGDQKGEDATGQTEAEKNAEDQQTEGSESAEDGQKPRDRHRAGIVVALLVLIMLVALLTFLVLPKDISGCSVIVQDDEIVYSGKSHWPDVTVMLYNKILTPGTDYTREYSNNTDAGEATVRVEGVGHYYGTALAHFTILKAEQRLSVSISDSSIEVGETAQLSVNGAVGDLTYSSSDESVATVDTDGQVMGKAMGTAEFTVEANATSNYKRATDSVSVTVTEKPTISASVDSLSLAVDEAKEVKLTMRGTFVEPWDCWYSNPSPNCCAVTWLGNRKKLDLKTYSSTLKITGKSVGTSIVTIHIVEGDDEPNEDNTIATAELEVTVS